MFFYLTLSNSSCSVAHLTQQRSLGLLSHSKTPLLKHSLGKPSLRFLSLSKSLLCFRNYVNLIAVSEHHHHHHNSNPRCYSCLLSSSFPSDYLDISPSQSPSYSEVTITPSSSSLAYLMSTLFGNRRWISPWSLYSTFGPLTLCFRVRACTE